MAFFSFSKRIKNRQFDYIPRYYDPDKEELEKRLKLYNRQGDDVDLAKERIRGGFSRNYRQAGDYAKKQKRRSNRILLMTLAVLVLLTLILLTQYLPKIVATFEQ